jgi:hypothetical protein
MISTREPARPVGEPERAVAALAAIAEVSASLGAARLAAEATEARTRLAQARFFVACLGQFKRGKSTLLNALAGEPVLPVGVVPVTSAITILRWGERPGAVVRHAAGQTTPIGLDDVAGFVDERRNPGNRLDVAAVEVFLPSPLLAGGLCLVDTPGLGSVFAASTAATRAFVPHIDAALVVVGPDPPISADELDLVGEVAGEVGDLIVVLNKADLASVEHRREVVAFTAHVLEERLGRAIGPVLEVSARERLEQGRPTRDWAALEGRLRQLTGDRGRQLAEAAAVRAVRRLGRRLLAELDEQDAALRRPVAELEARVQRLRTALTDVDRSLRDLRYLFDAVEADMARAVERQRQQFVRESLPALQSRLAAWVEQNGRALPAASLRRAAFSEARQIVTEAVARWLDAIEPQIEGLYREATARFCDLAAAHLEQAGADASILALDEDALPPERFDERRGFYFASLMYLTATGPRAWLIDRLAPRALRERDVTRAASAYLTQLLDTNTHRVESDLRDRTAASRQRLERAIRRGLAEALDAAGRGLSVAMASQRMAEDEVRGRLEELRRLRAMVSGLLTPPP